MTKKRLWKKTNYPGVRYRESDKRHGVGFDRYYAIRYRVNGKQIEEGLGWASDGWDVQLAAEELGRLKRAQRLGEGPQTLKEKQELSRARKEEEEKKKEQEERDALTFSQFWDDHYIEHAETTKTGRTARTEKGYFEKWIKPGIGDKPIKKVAPLDVERIKKNMLDAGRAPRSVQYCLAIIRQVFNRARDLNFYQGDSPTSKVKAPKFDNKRLRFLTYEEADKLLAALKAKRGQLHDIVLLSLHCGLRASEIFRLRWSAVNLDLRTLTIKDTKGGPNRTAYMTPDVFAMLERRKEKSKYSHVFVDHWHKGEIKEISGLFSRTVDELGFNDEVEDSRDKVCFHTLRHTFASWLVENGTDLYITKSLLGHASIAMTERYSHLGQNSLKKAVNGLAEKIQEREKEQEQEQSRAKVINLNQ